MKITRESIFSALFNLVNTNPPFVASSRKFMDWNAVGPAMQPFLTMMEMRQNASQAGHLGVTKWQLHAFLFIYCQHSPDQGTVPATNLNDLVDLVDNTLQPLPGQFQTLGGLVVSARIDGDVIIAEGALPNDTQSVAMLPVLIVCRS